MPNLGASQLHELLISKLPATGGKPLREFTASLPEVDRRAAQGQIQDLKLSGEIATWLVVGDDGKAVTYIGLAANKPPKP